MKALMKRLHGCLRPNSVTHPRLSPNFTLLTLLSQDHGLLNPFCSHSTPKSFPLYSMSQPLLYPKKSYYLFLLPPIPKKKTSVFSVSFSSISLSICFTPFRTETSRNSARLTCHFSYLFLVLLESHLVRFASVCSVSKSKQKQKFSIPLVFLLPSCPLPYPPFLFLSGHPKPPHSLNPQNLDRSRTFADPTQTCLFLLTSIRRRQIGPQPRSGPPVVPPSHPSRILRYQGLGAGHVPKVEEPVLHPHHVPTADGILFAC